MRKKEAKTTSSFGVADGFDFEPTSEESSSIIEPFIEAEPTPQKKFVPALANGNNESRTAELDPNRHYSKYYTPKPKKGARGGDLGRGAVKAEDKKIQFSVSCTPAQKEQFIEAAKKDHRKLPEFVCLAIEEYIRNHSL